VFDWYVWFCGGRLDPARRGAGRTLTQPLAYVRRSPTMVRRYEEPIEVRAGVGDIDPGGGINSVPDRSPTAFLWRGRLYVVRDVIGHWRERRAWWREALDPDEKESDIRRGVSAAHGLDCLEQEVWRVEASAGRLAGTGVYDLGMDGPVRGWRLLRVAD
jgi:Family of unknown function (DUF6504)